ncbi:TetR/AcrR family transcriptional regulator [Frankia sp. CNm7]|uniref:TetR/AcrR family transcriptional regulator n=1 Tax=Frankia nepalensis TaxID=1836974 RepID=A0A937RG33_9ACTN|nr:TetR/AcrR family transcriptional regulator [Frankia nepalensis]MBL7497374.1 TetR/AcrR family transcriptional regulator [Frankia nepalensis]MBL7512764.1 TetR/AcrR family transcriptional regulator [Frankia nepalensis]MBL7522518.1 TetR/AcrR family transcriptional regulator [Frankia nepalensis]MBL7629412.1 TetR/AcrR family transcriptional regulator [Frankia nepalensis]
MPAPVKHSADEMLDAVRALVLTGGPAAASARAVCLATGASSGSVYHRFPRRDDLVAAAWLRAQDHFLRVFLRVVDPPGIEAGIEAAVMVLTWSRDHPEDATLLLRHALRDLLRGDTSPALAERAAANQRTVGATFDALAAATGHPLPDLLLAVVDLPHTVARRTLRDGGVPTDDDIRAVRRAATLLLTHHPSDGFPAGRPES